MAEVEGQGDKVGGEGDNAEGDKDMDKDEGEGDTDEEEPIDEVPQISEIIQSYSRHVASVIWRRQVDFTFHYYLILLCIDKCMDF